MRYSLGILGGAVLFAAFVLVPAHVQGQQPAAPAERPGMREKLTNTQQLLEGVVTANFTIVDKSADRLAQISYTEVASWQSNAEPEYLKQASAFVKAVQGIRKASADRNSGALADEYSNLVNACVSCHSYVRHMRLAPLKLCEWNKASGSIGAGERNSTKRKPINSAIPATPTAGTD